MSVMKLLLAQLDVVPGDPAGNLRTLSAAYEEAVGQGATLLIAPELCDTAYDLTRVKHHAGEIRDAVIDLSKTGPAVLAGLSERADGCVYNTLTLGQDGRVAATYRKRHLIGLLGEPAVITPGRDSVTVNIGGLTWGLMICYDLRFPEQARELVLQHGAEVLCYVAAWPTPRHEHWRALLRARAIENQCYVVAVNRVGTDAGTTFCGSSMVVDPLGTILVEGGADRELIPLVLDASMVQRVRRELPFLDDA